MPDASVYVWLFIGVVVTFFVIFLAGRNYNDSSDDVPKEDDSTYGVPKNKVPTKSSETVYKTTSSVKEKEVISSGKPVIEKASGPQKITIYSFSTKIAKCNCPFCDGENNAGAKICSICQRDL